MGHWFTTSSGKSVQQQWIKWWNSCICKWQWGEYDLYCGKTIIDINGFSNNRTNFLIDWQAFAAKHGSFLRFVWEIILPSNIMKILYNKFCFSWIDVVLFRWLFFKYLTIYSFILFIFNSFDGLFFILIYLIVQMTSCWGTIVVLGWTRTMHWCNCA